jgi:hypothetical protein
MPEKVKPLHILLIKDNEHDRIAFQWVIKKECVGCDLTVCERAEEAEFLPLKLADVKQRIIDRAVRRKAQAELRKTHDEL